jgi:hypothetical protein
MTEDDVFIAIEREWKERNERFRQFVLAQGRPDILKQYDAQMRDIALGVSSARGIWHALSDRQRGVLHVLASGISYPKAREATWENLIRRRLVEFHNGVGKITEHGRFVLKHGQQANE